MTTYNNANFGGYSRVFGPGVYAQVDNDSITSIKVPQGYEIVFYADSNLQGESGRFTFGDYPNVGDHWNDRISSLVVKGGPAKTSYETVESCAAKGRVLKKSGKCEKPNKSKRRSKTPRVVLDQNNARAFDPSYYAVATPEGSRRQSRRSYNNTWG